MNEPAATDIKTLIDRVLQSEDGDIYTCLAADMNSFLTAMALLSQRKQIEAGDVRLLFEKFRSTLSLAPRSQGGPSRYAPQTKPQQPDAARLGARAVEGAMQAR